MESNLQISSVPLVAIISIATVIPVNIIKHMMMARESFDGDPAPRPRYYLGVQVMMIIETAVYFGLSLHYLVMTMRQIFEHLSFWGDVVMALFILTMWLCGTGNICLLVKRRKRYRRRLDNNI